MTSSNKTMVIWIASRYIKRFIEVAQAINKKKIFYTPGGTNSNATARTIIEAGLGIDIGASGHWTPGWDRNLLGDSGWQRWGKRETVKK